MYVCVYPDCHKVTDSPIKSAQGWGVQSKEREKERQKKERRWKDSKRKWVEE